MAVGVGQVASQPCSAGRLAVDQRRGHRAWLKTVLGEHGQRALRDRHLAERRRVHVIRHQHPPPAQATQVEDERPLRRGAALDGGICDEHLLAGPGPPEVEWQQEGQRPVAAAREEAERAIEIVLERPGSPVDRTHVVHADVEAAELVASVGTRATALEGRNLLADHVPRAGAVDRVARERQPEPASDPERPRLERDAPLQLAAPVGDRVAEREHAEPGSRVLCRRGQAASVAPARQRSGS